MRSEFAPSTSYFYLSRSATERTLLFHIQKNISRAPKKRNTAKEGFWRTYRRGDEAEGGAPIGITTNPNAYVEVQSHHALGALD
jgi:hypothetical protein